MKKFLFLSCLFLTSMMATAATETKAYQPPEKDIGVIANVQVDMTFEIIEVVNIVAWQTPIVPSMEAGDMSAQVPPTQASVMPGCTYVLAVLEHPKWPTFSYFDYTNYDTQNVKRWCSGAEYTHKSRPRAS